MAVVNIGTVQNPTVVSFIFPSLNVSIPPPPPDPFDWPSGLPQCPILQSFTERRQRNVASFKPDVGPPKQRRRSTAVAVETTVAFRMTNAQVAIFDTFYETTLKDGTLPFHWNHPITGTTHDWMFTPDDAPIKERVTSGTMRISFTLFRLP